MRINCPTSFKYLAMPNTNHYFDRLLEASSKDYFRYLKRLVNHGYNVNHSNRVSNTTKDLYGTLLHLAVRRNWEEDVINWLLHNGADINALSSTKETPLHWAIKKRRQQIALILLSNFQIEPSGEYKASYLHLAIQNNLGQVVQYLVHGDPSLINVSFKQKNSLEYALSEKKMDKGIAITRTSTQLSS